MKADLQKSYHGERSQPDRPVTTRLTLFGRGDDRTLVGNTCAEAYHYKYPFLYVLGRQETDGRESVFPALIEPFAGQPFLAENRPLPIRPAQQGADAAVALEVKTTAGTTDLLFASANPATRCRRTPPCRGADWRMISMRCAAMFRAGWDCPASDIRRSGSATMATATARFPSRP